MATSTVQMPRSLVELPTPGSIPQDAGFSLENCRGTELLGQSARRGVGREQGSEEAPGSRG